MDKYLEPKRLIPALVQCSGDPEQVSMEGGCGLEACRGVVVAFE